ncbi:MAG: carbon storage regulator [Candidatus Cloacimonadota bacterium]|nr:MAG: carbon storage regulator [Candidatus Cloacimonadota bacterium]
MLILTRKTGESIIVGDNIEIVVAEINKNSARIGIKAPKDLSIYRKEIYDKILKENEKAVNTDIDQNTFEQLNDLVMTRIGG